MLRPTENRAVPAKTLPWRGGISQLVHIYKNAYGRFQFMISTCIIYLKVKGEPNITFNPLLHIPCLDHDIIFH